MRRIVPRLPGLVGRSTTTTTPSAGGLEVGQRGLGDRADEQQLGRVLAVGQALEQVGPHVDVRAAPRPRSPTAHDDGARRRSA